MSASIAVVKVGGSLYDLPDLGPRLRRWLAENLAGNRVVLVPGGGGVVDAIRQLDRCHGLSEETSHWLALRALTVNAHFLAALLPQSSVHGDVSELHRAWDKGELPILDAHEFALRDEARPGRLPHSWAVTSDAVAARAAVVLQASRLVLLKSTTIPKDVDWTEAIRLGWVDEEFASVLGRATPELLVSTVNLRRASLHAIDNFCYI
jgi:aspartokinase-like uncharacterized kinase